MIDIESSKTLHWYESWIDEKFKCLYKDFEKNKRDIDTIDKIRMDIRQKLLSHEKDLLSNCLSKDKVDLYIYLHKAIIKLDTQTLDWFNSKSSPKRS